MPILTSCPACNRQLRIPDDLVGRKVRCPTCAHIFEAWASGAAPAAPPPPPPEEEDHTEPELPRRRRTRDEYDEPEDEGYEDERRRRRKGRKERGRQAVQAPAICLLILGILWMLLWAANGILTLNNIAAAPPQQPLRAGPAGPAGPFGAPQQQKNPFEQMFQPGLPADPAERAGYIISLVAGLGFGFICGILIILGAISMMRMRSRGMAITGSIAAMIPCSLCCILGLPFGIWSLIVLSRDEVKSAFS